MRFGIFVEDARVVERREFSLGGGDVHFRFAHSGQSVGRAGRDGHAVFEGLFDQGLEFPHGPPVVVAALLPLKPVFVDVAGQVGLQAAEGHAPPERGFPEFRVDDAGDAQAGQFRGHPVAGLMEGQEVTGLLVDGSEHPGEVFGPETGGGEEALEGEGPDLAHPHAGLDGAPAAVVHPPADAFAGWGGRTIGPGEKLLQDAVDVFFVTGHPVGFDEVLPPAHSVEKPEPFAVVEDVQPPVHAFPKVVLSGEVLPGYDVVAAGPFGLGDDIVQVDGVPAPGPHVARRVPFAEMREQVVGVATDGQQAG